METINTKGKQMNKVLNYVIGALLIADILLLISQAREISAKDNIIQLQSEIIDSGAHCVSKCEEVFEEWGC